MNGRGDDGESVNAYRMLDVLTSYYHVVKPLLKVVIGINIVEVFVYFLH